MLRVAEVALGPRGTWQRTSRTLFSLTGAAMVGALRVNVLHELSVRRVLALRLAQ